MYEGGQVLHVAKMLQGFPVMFAVDWRFVRLLTFLGYLPVDGLFGDP